MKLFDRLGQTNIRIFFVFVLGITSALATSGCPAASSSSKVTKQEEANFKGGPMPADFKPGAGQGPPQNAPK